ncbi:hypothetical protein ACEYYH_10695 [Microbacterium trichothecenolyticum]|uniref:hypothetical protein n=1 Tax=Microbacterium trichothecenolyticum TaxID=69370 RepID=UPI0035BE302D
MIVVMGFDTSLSTTGVSRVDLERDAEGVLQAVEWFTARAIVKGPAPTSVARENRRLVQMISRTLAHVPRRVDLSVIEGPATRAKHSGKADERSGLRWMLINQLCARGPVVIVDPQTRAVLAWGKGMPRRKKGETSDQAKAPVLAAVRAMVPAARIADHNVADAVALTYAGAHALGMPADYTAAQVSAHENVSWPEMGGLVPVRKG